MKSQKIQVNQNLMAKLRQKNKIFFDNASFHGDKGYKIENGNILVVETSHGYARYIIEDNYNLEYKRD